MPTTFDLSLFAAVAVLACSDTGPAAEGARILAVETFGAKSHWKFMSGVIRALVDRGHHVTAFTPFPDGGGLDDSSRGNYTEVDASGAVPVIPETDLMNLVRSFGDAVAMVGPVVATSRRTCDAIYAHPEMKRLLRGPAADFDAVLIEPLLSDCVSYAARRTRVPLIYVKPLPALGALERLCTGRYPHPAVESHVMARHGRPVGFARRLTNALLTVYWELARAYHDAALARTAPSDYDLAEPVAPSLVFVNGHHAGNAPGAGTAEVVHVGGVHLRPAEPLPRDILEIIENSPHGVICFTFGSITKMSTLPNHLKKAIFEALALVPQKVLLKYDIDMEDIPKNIITMKWLPQRDILMHPNVKLFISHGGISGVYEAVDAGVPVLGFPLFVDQYRNIDNLVHAGMAISMDLLTVTKSAFLSNVLELLNNKKYRKNAKIASEVFKDRPLSPAEQVVYWTEYVIRHKGAPHLKSHAINLTWYQYYLLDVIAVVLIFITVIVFIAYIFLKSVYQYFCILLRRIKFKSE